MKLRADVIVPKDLLLDVKKMDRAIQNAMDGAALGAKIDFDVTTRTWKKRPAFLIKKPRPWMRDIYTIDDIYQFVSGGTRAHVIRSRRRGGRLAFYRSGFRPKTRHRYLGSNKGKQASSDFVTPESVQHPGTKAREFDEAVKEKWDKQLPKVLQRAIDAEVS